MAEYLDKKKLLENITDDYGKWTSYNDCEESYRQGVADNYSDTIRLISEMSAEDVQPTKQGHWYDNTYRSIGELDAYFIQACCSCCNRYSDRLDQYTKIMSNETCSHCGARMDGESDG